MVRSGWAGEGMRQVGGFGSGQANTTIWVTSIPRLVEHEDIEEAIPLGCAVRANLAHAVGARGVWSVLAAACLAYSMAAG